MEYGFIIYDNGVSSLNIFVYLPDFTGAYWMKVRHLKFGPFGTHHIYASKSPVFLSKGQKHSGQWCTNKYKMQWIFLWSFFF